MAAQRSPEEIRASIEQHRKELASSMVVLRNEVAELADWRKQVAAHQDQLMIGAAVAGFVLGGGIAGVVGILTPGRRRRRKRGR